MRHCPGAAKVLAAVGFAAAAASCGAADAADRAAAIAAPLPNVPLPEPQHTIRAGPLPSSAGTGLPAPRRLFAVGGEGASDGLTFSQIADVDVGADGTVYVLDRMERAVTALSANGRMQTRFGRRGRGPGEFEDPTDLFVLPWNGELAVWDGSLQRLTLFTSAGRVTATRKLPLPSPAADVLPVFGRTVQRLGAFSRGFLVEVRSDPMRVPPEAQRGYLVRLDTTFQHPDTLLTFAVGPIIAEHREDGGSTYSSWRAPAHFSPRAAWDVFPDGTFAFTPADRYRAYLFDATGKSAIAVERPWSAVPLTRQDRLRMWRAVRAEMPTPYGRVSSVNETERKTRGLFARLRPAVSGLLRDGDGGFCLRRFDTADDGRGESRVWDCYDRAARPTVSTRLEAGFRPMRIGGGRFYGVRRDSLGVQSLEVYQRF